MTCARVKRVYEAPCARRVEDAVVNQRRRFESAQGSEISKPCEAEPAYRLFVDLLKVAKTLLGVRLAVRDPIRGVRVCRLKRSVIDDNYPTAATTRHF